MDSDPKESNPTPSFADRSYALSGRIMLSAIVVLFFVVVVMICLHLYARWYLLRARRRQMRRRSRRSANLVLYLDPDTANPTTAAASSRGLDASVLKSLPLFVYSSDSQFESMECAVCLSEFEDKEKGRTLPHCKHSFHTECIDMWFHSHSTCPLCRSPVEPVAVSSDVEVVTPSDLCNSCADHVGPSTSAESREMRKPVRDLDVRIDVPRRTGNFGDASSSSVESPASQGFRSPMSRMLSFTRILSRDWRGNNPSPRSPIPTSCGGTSAASEDGGIVDLERGKEEVETRPSTGNELAS